MDPMTYPTDTITDRGILPWARLPRNFQELVPKFYEHCGREKIERFVKEGSKVWGRFPAFETFTDIRLSWDDRDGLMSITVTGGVGLDLDKRSGIPSFQEHNLGMYSGVVAGLIARKYVSELVKCAKKEY